MNASTYRPQRTRSGFTLIEVLVSITVLGLIMVGVSQMMNGAINATLGGYKHLDADTQARLVLDRMAFDISKITKRTDVDYFFQKNATTAGTTPGNDQMAFYSESGGYYPAAVTPATQGGNVSLVGYMIDTMSPTTGLYSSTGIPQLVRLSKGLTWNGYSSTLPAMVFNPLANPASASPNLTVVTNNKITSTWPQVSTPNNPDTDYHVIGDQVFRLEYTFLVQTSPTSSAATVTQAGFYDYPAYYSSTYPADTTPNALKDVTAIVVSIAVLDTKTRALLGSNAATLLNTAASDLPDDACVTSGAPTSGTASSYLPLPLWKAALVSNSLGLPAAAASQVRFYQRFCYLNHLQ